jgi:hypothetical protein
MTVTAKHIVLAGDSIFDNDVYVMGELGVIEQMRRSLPAGWSAFKIAVDGDCIRDVSGQVEDLPTHATHLVVSVGGNDLIGYAHLLNTVRSRGEIEGVLAAPKATFVAQYEEMLDGLQKLPVQLIVCTIYTAIPFEEPILRSFGASAIGAFNDLIRERAAARNIPVLRLDHICTEPDDFSAVSPIEPSAKGGQKIVDHLIDFIRPDA